MGKAKTVILTVKRKNFIQDFKNNQENNAGVGSNTWTQDLAKFLFEKDKDITAEVVKRWMKNHSWITGTTRPNVRRLPSPILPSPEVDHRPTATATQSTNLPRSDPDPSSNLGLLGSLPHYSQNPHGVTNQNLIHQTFPQSYHFNTEDVMFGFGHQSTMAPPPQQPQQNSEGEKKKVYEQVFVHIHGLEKYFQTMPEFRTLINPLVVISKAVTRKFSTSNHGEPLRYNNLRTNSRTASTRRRCSPHFG